MKILDFGGPEWLVVDPRYSEGASPTSVRPTLSVPKYTAKGARWAFDGSVECPTITPSINEWWGPIPGQFRVPREDGSDGSFGRNHYFITAGSIQFLGDCTHEWAGKTLALPDFTDIELRYYESRRPKEPVA